MGYIQAKITELHSSFQPPDISWAWTLKSVLICDLIAENRITCTHKREPECHIKLLTFISAFRACYKSL